MSPQRISSSDVLKSLNFLDRNVLVKGGDLPASLDAVDVFYDGKCSNFLRSLGINCMLVFVRT